MGSFMARTAERLAVGHVEAKVAMRRERFYVVRFQKDPRRAAGLARIAVSGENVRSPASILHAVAIPSSFRRSAVFPVMVPRPAGVRALLTPVAGRNLSDDRVGLFSLPFPRRDRTFAAFHRGRHAVVEPRLLTALDERSSVRRRLQSTANTAHFQREKNLSLRSADVPSDGFRRTVERYPLMKKKLVREDVQELELVASHDATINYSLRRINTDGSTTWTAVTTVA